MEARTLNRTSWKTCIMPSSKTQPAISMYSKSKVDLLDQRDYLESMERDSPVMCLFASDQIRAPCGAVVNKPVTAITLGFVSWICAMAV